MNNNKTAIKKLNIKNTTKKYLSAQQKCTKTY